MLEHGNVSRPILREFFRNAHEVSKLGGPSWPRQLLEALLLRLPPSRLGLSEYFDYRLFEPGRTLREKRSFVGWRGEPALDLGNAENCHVYANDKVRLALLLANANLPHPRLSAVYRYTAAIPDGTVRLSTPEGLANWLRTCQEFPLFAKPVHAGFGKGAFLLQGIDAAGENLLLGHGEQVRIEDWVVGLPNPEGMGYLLQPAVAPHPRLAELQCGRLSSLRVMILHAHGAEPCIYRAVWKIPRKFNIIDNFESGSLGNLLASIDLESGRVLRVIKGYGLSRQQLDRHPDSGLAFGNLVLPDWDRLLEISLAASRLLPEFRFQHWDVALTADGPVLLEINLFSAGGTELSQLADERGLLEPRLLNSCR